MKTNIAVVGLGYGDEGKGTVVDYLVNRFGYKYNFRFNGGPQAAHNVVTPEGEHHTFAQFGSGMFNKHCHTFLHENMLVDPIAFDKEYRVLTYKGHGDFITRISIDPQCFVVTYLHTLVNRIKETHREKRLGTCGMGVGEAVRDILLCPNYMIRMRDLEYPEIMLQKLRWLHTDKVTTLTRELEDWGSDNHEQDLIDFREISLNKLAEELHQFYKNYKSIFRSSVAKPPLPVIYESAQGSLLDPHYGFAPYVTKSSTINIPTFRTKTIGVLRAYATRHGNGPFVTYCPDLTLDEKHNKHNNWQGEFKIGNFDLVTAKYALDITKVDALAITHLDRVQYPLKVVTSYASNVSTTILSYYFHLKGREIVGIKNQISDPARTIILMNSVPWDWEWFDDEKSFLKFLEKELGKPIVLKSYGPTRKDKTMLPWQTLKSMLKTTEQDHLS